MALKIDYRAKPATRNKRRMKAHPLLKKDRAGLEMELQTPEQMRGAILDLQALVAHLMEERG